MAQPIKLTGEQVVEISVMDHNNPYKNGQRAKDKKTYSRYKFDGTVFTVDTDNPFVQAQINGEVKSVKLISGEREIPYVDNDGKEQISVVKTLAYDSFVSRAQYKALQEDRMLDAKVEATIKHYENIATVPVSDSLLNEIMA